MADDLSLRKRYLCVVLTLADGLEVVKDGRESPPQIVAFRQRSVVVMIAVIVMRIRRVAWITGRAIEGSNR